MRYVAAYLLATLHDEKTAPTVDKIKSILASVGIEADSEAISMVIKKFGGQLPSKVIATGSERLSSCGGGAAPAAAATSGGGAASAAAEEKKPAKEEEPEEESDDDMGFGLFD